MPHNTELWQKRLDLVSITHTTLRDILWELFSIPLTRNIKQTNSGFTKKSDRSTNEISLTF